VFSLFSFESIAQGRNVRTRNNNYEPPPPLETHVLWRRAARPGELIINIHAAFLLSRVPTNSVARPFRIVIIIASRLSGT